MKLKKLKHIFLASCVTAPFIGLSAIVNNSSNNEISSKLNEFDLIPLAKELNRQPKNKKVKMYMHNDVPYIGIKEFLDAVSKIVKNENIEYSFDVKKVVLTYKTDKEGKNSLKIVIDYDKQKITVSDYSFFISILRNHERGEEKLDIEFLKSENKNLTKEFEYDLRKYDIFILKDKSDLYLPQILLNQIFLNESNIQTYFNGEVLNLFRFVESLSGSGYFYLRQSIKNNETSIPSGLKEFQAKYFSFLLDHYYGIKFNEDETMNESYKGFIETYKNRITHTNSDIHYLTTREIIRDLDDSHTAYILDGYYSKNNEVLKHPIKSNKRITDRFNLGEKLGKLYFKSNIEYQNVFTPDGKTSVISFKAFEENSAVSIEKSLNEAKEKGIKNIIFNVTHNGGGYIGAAYEIMGFLSDKPFNVWTHNPLTGENKIETIKSKKTKYDFNYFVLTAPFSFSAGNIFPQLVRDNNLGKIIGYDTFGGSSAIGYYILPTGDIIQLSSNTVFTDKNFKTTEFGISPDYPFKENIETGAKNLYDLDYLQKFVNDINKESKKEPNKPINKPDTEPLPKPAEPSVPISRPHNNPEFNSDNGNIMIIIPDSGFTPNNIEKSQGKGRKAGIIAGISVGIASGVAALSSMSYFLVKKFRK
ncbi:carboxy-terminal protease [Mycoplasmopsis agalactiae]|uniref:S41 family peptidase n=1 Tax=Mycoplasmopsis agalactiae TaxID=2110 RepID=UPI000C70BFBF|nr:S41 family peptidase [Mycoplasmopsis agalactiae]SBO45025.1 carboxy-terminal protease [Mycoplasmopsis agalactiae]